jgi:hypothetical protein
MLSSPWYTILTQAKSNRATWSWTETSKTVSQISLSSFWVEYLRCLLHWQKAHAWGQFQPICEKPLGRQVKVADGQLQRRALNVFLKPVCIPIATLEQDGIRVKTKHVYTGFRVEQNTKHLWWTKTSWVAGTPALEDGPALHSSRQSTPMWVVWDWTE